MCESAAPPSGHPERAGTGISERAELCQNLRFHARTHSFSSANLEAVHEHVLEGLGRLLRGPLLRHVPRARVLRHPALGRPDRRRPLFKYEVHGPDAAAYLSSVTVKDVSKLEPGRVTYLCWCDDDGKVVDDGTVARLDDEHFRVTAAEPALSWF